MKKPEKRIIITSLCPAYKQGHVTRFKQQNIELIIKVIYENKAIVLRHLHVKMVITISEEHLPGRDLL